jgi:hypothetical protein
LFDLHGPAGLSGKVISFCDQNNKNFGISDKNAGWHNREYVVNGRLSETHCVIVLWDEFDSKKHKESDKKFAGL